MRNLGQPVERQGRAPVTKQTSALIADVLTMSRLRFGLYASMAVV